MKLARRVYVENERPLPSCDGRGSNSTGSTGVEGGGGRYRTLPSLIAIGLVVEAVAVLAGEELLLPVEVTGPLPLPPVEAAALPIAEVLAVEVMATVPAAEKGPRADGGGLGGTGTDKKASGTSLPIRVPEHAAKTSWPSRLGRAVSPSAAASLAPMLNHL